MTCSIELDLQPDDYAWYPVQDRMIGNHRREIILVRVQVVRVQVVRFTIRLLPWPTERLRAISKDRLLLL
jgi:hypothetical protein